MQEIKRDIYLNRLVERQGNGSIKVITGIRRCGNSYLLFNLFYNYLLERGIAPGRIIRVALDAEEFADLQDGKLLGAHVRERVGTDGLYYIFLDEVQLVPGFERVLNGLNRLPNVDIYVTGSNSRFLSSDVVTEFRGRGDEVRVQPLSFAEFLTAYDGSQQDAWNDYFTYGGLPQILSRHSDAAKSRFLIDLFQSVYLRDIIERKGIRLPEVMGTLVNILASAVGSLTNPTKLARTFASAGFTGVSDKTLGSYLASLMDAFIISRAERYDIKGKKYISSPCKYYFCDVGLRNARLNFRQQEENHIMENIIYNELLLRGFNVDVGVVETTTNENRKRIRKQLEIDFVCNQGSKRYYIQSAFAIPDAAKMQQEQKSLMHIRDSFKKIIVVKDNIKLWRNDFGIVVMGIQEFLLRQDSLDA